MRNTLKTFILIGLCLLPASWTLADEAAAASTPSVVQRVAEWLEGLFNNTDGADDDEFGGMTAPGG